VQRLDAADGSVGGGDRLLLTDQRTVLLPGGLAAGPDRFADAIPGNAGLPGSSNSLTELALGEGGRRAAARTAASSVETAGSKSSSKTRDSSSAWLTIS